MKGERQWIRGWRPLAVATETALIELNAERAWNADATHRQPSIARVE
jgi:hypothetical protein